MTETKRDLPADLAICRAATSGPWTNDDGDLDINAVCAPANGCPVCGDFGPERPEDSRFIAEARTGWPHAIERAINAEEQVGALIELLREATDMIIPNESDYKCDYRRSYIRHQIPKIVPEVADYE